MRRSTRGWWGAVMALMIVTACSNSTPSTTVSPTASPTATRTPEPTATPTPSPTPSPTPTPTALCATEDKSCPLEPGSYASTVFKPAFSFTVGEGWSNDWDFARLGEISDVPGSLVWQEGVDKTLAEDFGLDDVGSSPEELVAFLQDHPDLEVGPITPVTVDGAPGLTIDVTPRRTLQGVFVTAPFAPQSTAGSKERYIILEVANTTVLFQITSDKAADFESYMTRVQPIIDSIHWQ